MSPLLVLALYCALLVVASLVGGWLPRVVQMTHTRQQLTMSFVSGVMIGVALLHLMPHALEQTQSINRVALWMLAGLLVMFFLMRAFHAHRHEGVLMHEPHAHEHHLEHAHGHAAEHHHANAGEVPSHKAPSGHRSSWMGVFFGMALHSILDGVALAASVLVDAGHGAPGTAILAMGTFLAIFLHKPLDALSVTSVMHAGGWSGRSQAVVNGAFALLCPIGAAAFWIGASGMTADGNQLVGDALAFSAGLFLCIALADLLPEVAFHTHDRLKLSAALLLGVAIALAIESTHSHAHHGGDAGHGHGLRDDRDHEHDHEHGHDHDHDH